MKKRATAIFSTLAVIAILVTAASAPAQSGYKLRVHVPFDFAVGNRTCSAGWYSVGTSSSLELIKVQSADGKNTALVTSTVPIRPNGLVERAQLEFKRYGDRYFLHKIWLGSAGRVLPKGRLERELIEGRSEAALLRVETVIVAAN